MTDSRTLIEGRSRSHEGGSGSNGSLLLTDATADTFAPPSPVDAGHVEDGKAKFLAWRAPADTPSSPPSPLPPEQRVGVLLPDRAGWRFRRYSRRSASR